jgi:hypothetical protein
VVTAPLADAALAAAAVLTAAAALAAAAPRAPPPASALGKLLLTAVAREAGRLGSRVSRASRRRVAGAAAAPPGTARAER